MSIPKWLAENINTYDTWDEWISACVSSLGVSRSGVLKKSHRLWTLKGGKKITPPLDIPQKKPAASMTRSQFLSKFDINTKTREALRRGVATLTESDNSEDDEILEDSEFRLDRCHDVSLQVYRKIANEPEFKNYQFRMGDRILWTTPRQHIWAIENVTKAQEL